MALQNSPLVHLSEYELHHLAEHLEASGRVEDLHSLLSLETSEQRNAWHDAKEARGDMEGYLADVRRAWKLAEMESAESFRQGKPAISIAREVRYGIIIASLNSLASNIPPALLRVLVERETWTCSQALAYATQVPDPVQRSEALGDLAQVCQQFADRAFREALVAIDSIEDIYWREAATARIAPRLPEDLRHQVLLQRPMATRALIDAYSGGGRQDTAPVRPLDSADETELQSVLTATESLEDTSKVDRLISLLPHLPGSLLQETLAIADSVKEEFKRTVLMTGLVRRMIQVGQLDEAATVMEGIAFIHNRTEALSRFIDASSGPSQGLSGQNGVAAARAIKDPHWRAATLTELASRVPSQLQDEFWTEALDAARRIGDDQQQAELLTDIAVLLNALRVSDRALAIIDALPDVQWEAKALMLLVPRLPEDKLSHALASSRLITDGHWRAECLKSISARLTEMARPPVWAEAIEAAMTTTDKRLKIRTLSRLVPYLPEALKSGVLHTAMDATRSLENEHWRAEGLAFLVVHLPKDLLGEALVMARAMTDKEDRSLVMAEIAPSLARLGCVHQALHMAEQEIEDVHWQQQALRTLSQEYSTLNHPAQALRASKQLAYEHWQAAALSIQASCFPDEGFGELVRVAQAIREPRQRALALTQLSPHLPEPQRAALLEESLEAVQGIEDEEERGSALADLAPYLSRPLLSKVVAAATQMTDTADKIEALGALLPHLAEWNQQEAIDIAKGIAEKSRRAMVLAHLYPKLTDPHRGRILHEVTDALQGSADLGTQLGLISKIMPYLDNLSVTEAYACWRRVLVSMASQNRRDLLENLRNLLPMLAMLGGSELLESLVKTLQDIRRWWP